jgi:hypothetical protein
MFYQAKHHQTTQDVISLIRSSSPPSDTNHHYSTSESPVGGTGTCGSVHRCEPPRDATNPLLQRSKSPLPQSPAHSIITLANDAISAALPAKCAVLTRLGAAHNHTQPDSWPSPPLLSV